MKNKLILFTILFLFVANAFAQTFSSGNISVAIPDDGNTYPGGGVCNSVAVSDVGTIDGDSLIVSSVCVYIDHTYNGDLDIFIVSPIGTVVSLSSGRGGSGDDFGTSIGSMCFDMYASASITTVSSTGPITGSYKPEGSFTDFNSENANGNWQLCVGDDYASDSGTLLGWSITFDSAPAPTCSDGIMNQDETGIDCGGTYCPECGLGDDVCNPIPLTVNTECVFQQFSNVGMTQSLYPGNPGCASFSGPDIWFAVTVPAGGHIIFDQNTGVITDAGMAVYSGTDCNNLTLVDCDDDGSSNGSMSYIELTERTEGETLWVRVWEYGGNIQGTFSICAHAPIPTCSDGIQNQDETGIDCGGISCAACADGTNCQNPMNISNLPYSEFSTTCGFINDYSSADACGSTYMNGEDVVYSYTPIEDETISAGISNASAIKMGLFILDSCPDDTTASCIASSESDTGIPTICATNLIGGQTYYFIVATQSTTACSDFKLIVSKTLIEPDTIYTCDTVFYDLGGLAGDYSVCENYIKTYCSDNPANVIQVTFTEFDVNNSDNLFVYDGIDTSATLLYNFNNDNAPTQAIKPSYLNTSGCLTFNFQSDDSNEGSVGWIANVNCSDPCQSVEAYSTGGALNIDICQGATVNFEGSGIYSNNDESYHQSDSTSTFEWRINNDVVATTQNFNYVFTNQGLYGIDLRITDTNGCQSINSIQQKVRVSITPSFAGTEINPTSTCVGYPIILKGNATPETIISELNNIYNDTTLIPDGSGAEYTTSINFISFNAGQIINSADDIKNICMNIEHSYVGDLDVFIECPNSSTATLFNLYTGTGSTNNGAYLGIPLGGADHSDYDDTPYTDPTVNLPGEGYDYCFNMNGITSINNVGTGSGTTVPSDSYLPVGDFNSLVGCPLNGTWAIHMIDNIAADNGYIFSWGITFADEIYSEVFSFEDEFASEGIWTGQELSGTVSDSISITPDAEGLFDYTYTIIDSIGCVFDTTLTLTVQNLSASIIGTDNFDLGDSIAVNTTGGTPPYSILWNTGEAFQVITPDSSGLYYAFVSDVNGCQANDSANIIITNLVKNSILDKINIHPNPNNGQFNIVINSKEKGKMQLRLFDLNGKLIFTESLEKNNDILRKHLEFSYLAKGVYHLQVLSEREIINQKIIIE
ncbi:MAG: hypothetical protein A2W98_10000 [Bacteroidetes bacterium GWF2_33_38]|nr:MAG: hypothetical protein A2W98_10000 [Bacteroidetes bacterium GWF2_33_38]OFY68507.1 MAG: hypothetical protein A2265_07745 [Bacteroidetes bacterium RIFOXYA12_FULL_33_9]OFY91612.1 MAG: hypothetical protein A2236_11475 [Bacteroidetes bacterium RIFOXYA2_FULL_33_7]HBX52582.1 hypothetical protein [Bacteroidales bacterium]